MKTDLKLVFSVLVAAAALFCAVCPRAAAAEWNAYVLFAHSAESLGYDVLNCYDQDGGVVWTNWDNVAGNGAVVGLDRGPAGFLYSCQWDGRRLQKHDPETGEILFDIALNDGQKARDVVAGPGGVYVVARTTGEEVDGVHIYNIGNGDYIEKFIDESLQPGMSGLAFGPDGNLYICDSSTVAKYDGSTGAMLDDEFITGGDGFGKLKWYRGDLYVSEMGTAIVQIPDGSILRYSSSGTFLGDFVAAGEGDLRSPMGFDFTPDGGILVGDYWAGENFETAVRQYSKTGASLGVFAMVPGDFTPNGWAYDVEVVDLSSKATSLIVR